MCLIGSTEAAAAVGPGGWAGWVGVQDKEDDRVVGVRSTALLFGEQTRPILGGFSGCLGVGLCTAGAAAELGGGYYAAVVAALAHLAWQVAALST